MFIVSYEYMGDFVSILNEYSLTHMKDGKYKEYERDRLNYDDICEEVCWKTYKYKDLNFKYHETTMNELIHQSDNLVTEYIYNEYNKIKPIKIKRDKYIIEQIIIPEYYHKLELERIQGFMLSYG